MSNIISLGLGIILAKTKSNDNRKLRAGIQYHGEAGSTLDCINAVMRLIQFNDQISRARILTCSNEHCLLLTINTGDLVAVKSGFSSGYRGEGPRGFSYILQLLDALEVTIEELGVRKDLIKRLDNSSLTQLDLDKLDQSRPIRPSRWFDYVTEEDWERQKDGSFWEEFPQVVPFAIIDPRIADLANSFWAKPDQNLVTGYRRLEDIVRNRTSLEGHGSRLFSNAFDESNGRLFWKGLNRSEHAGRVSLFTSTYQAFRNPRAHRELKENSNKMLAEFVHLNHLYLLESEALEKPDKVID